MSDENQGYEVFAYFPSNPSHSLAFGIFLIESALFLRHPILRRTNDLHMHVYSRSDSQIGSTGLQLLLPFLRENACLQILAISRALLVLAPLVDEIYSSDSQASMVAPVFA